LPTRKPEKTHIFLTILKIFEPNSLNLAKQSGKRRKKANLAGGYHQGGVAQH
jgi:hypothetical protein